MKRRLWILVVFLFIISLFVVIFYFNVPYLNAASKKEEIVYPLRDNSTISSSQILSVQNDIISEYTKGFERYQPENKQFPQIFYSSSFNSTIILTYDGDIAFCFSKSMTPNTTIVYFNEDQQHTSHYNFKEPCSHSVMVSVSDLNHNFSRWLGLWFYLDDYTTYFEENTRLRRIENERLQKLNQAKENLTKIYQTDDDFEKAKATLYFYQLAEDLGYSDNNTNRILEDLKAQYPTQLNNLTSESQLYNNSKNRSETTWDKIKDFFKEFWLYILFIIASVFTIIRNFLSIRTLLKERSHIKKEITNLFNRVYERLYKLIKQ